ncbi:uncharacterized protein LOC120293341 [Eucalyptus grandis]|uniref:uncharacterized protein LOC120293341 n=1 Tax=Eucalyptus grandis TaxID=71139 RepID=UPI00192ED881|nr:uncharacterized protein LOC120293341 [Eucalyptus grandis]XP_039168395.1 uncharacterized protein LOC120293341 [Eucalyptus grandis]
MPLDVSILSQRGAGDREMREIHARTGAIHRRGRSTTPSSPLVSVDDDDYIRGADSRRSDGKRPTNAPQSSMGDSRNALLVVAALIASTTYQAVIQLPSFIKEVDSTKGFHACYASVIAGPLGTNLAYIIFMSGNTFGFLVSVQMIICLTRDLPVRLPLLLSVTTMVQTYYCFTFYLPFTLQDKAFGLKNVELLSMLPVTMSILLLLAQRPLALALDICLEMLSRFNLLGDMYSLRTQSVIVKDREIGEINAPDGAEHRRTNSHASRLVSEEDQSDGEPVANSKLLNKERESIGDTRNTLLIVATLIASATYQAVLQPPSFRTKVDDHSTKSFLAHYASWVTRPLGRDFVYIGFISCNTFGILLSIQMIICLTRDLPVRLPLLLSVTALVQTYYCFTYYLPFTLLDKAFGLINVELLTVLPITTSILLLLAQRPLALALNFWLEKLSCFNLLGNMYSLGTQLVDNKEAGAEHRRGRSNLHASRLLSEEDKSDAKSATNAPQSLYHFPSKNLNKDKESMWDIRNALLVVAALIASTTYQAVHQPPSFTTKVDSSSMKGFLASYESWMTGPLGRDLAYIAFMSGNTFGLLVSVQMIICLTRDLPIRLPLLLSMIAMVQTYYCFTYFLPFTLLDKGLGLKNVKLLSILPVMISLLLLLAQRWLALALDSCLERLSHFNLLGDMYSLWTLSVIVNGKEIREINAPAGAKLRRRRANLLASRLVSEEDQLDWETAANLKILNKGKESIGDIRNALLAVATLIASVTYQAVLQPPSFGIKVEDNSTKGFLANYASWVTGPLGRDIAYFGFITGNTFGLLLSIQMIICLTRDLPIRLPLLLSMTALVQTYYCFTYYLPFTLLDKTFGLINVELWTVLPIMTSILLLLAQRRLALALNFWLEKLSCFNLLGDMYSLGTQPVIVTDKEVVAEHGRGRSNSLASRLLLEEDQLDVEPVTNAPQSLSYTPSKNLNKEKETMGDKRNALLVVIVLIASTTYQAVLQPPRFTTKVDSSFTKGFLTYYASWVTCLLGRDVAYIAFMSGNTFGLLLSIQMIICLTRDLTVRLPLLLSVTAMVLTYYCFTCYLLFTLLDKTFDLKNGELWSVLLLVTPLLLLLIQRRLALALNFCLKRLSQFNLLGDMYRLKT